MDLILKDRTGSLILTVGDFMRDLNPAGAGLGAGRQVFEYVDKLEVLPVHPRPEEAPERPKQSPKNNRRPSKNRPKQKKKRPKRRQDGRQTEDPHGERETQQEHHSARKCGQVNGEFSNGSSSGKKHG